MYAQFEAAGLIVGTEEWEEEQEQKYRQMMGEKQTMDRLHAMADSFNMYMKNKNYSEAASCYKKARGLAVSCRLAEERMHILFGERGERGVILRQGLFREDLVQKAYYEEFVKRKEPVEGYQKK